MSRRVGGRILGAGAATSACPHAGSATTARLAAGHTLASRARDDGQSIGYLDVQLTAI